MGYSHDGYYTIILDNLKIIRFYFIGPDVPGVSEIIKVRCYKLKI